MWVCAARANIRQIEAEALSRIAVQTITNWEPFERKRRVCIHLRYNAYQKIYMKLLIKLQFF